MSKFWLKSNARTLDSSRKALEVAQKKQDADSSKALQPNYVEAVKPWHEHSKKRNIFQTRPPSRASFSSFIFSLLVASAPKRQNLREIESESRQQHPAKRSGVCVWSVVVQSDSWTQGQGGGGGGSDTNPVQLLYFVACFHDKKGSIIQLPFLKITYLMISIIYGIKTNTTTSSIDSEMVSKPSHKMIKCFESMISLFLPVTNGNVFVTSSWCPVLVPPGCAGWLRHH